MQKFIWTVLLLLFACKGETDLQNESTRSAKSKSASELYMYDKSFVINKANDLLGQSPTPITMFVAERSRGGIHDFFSEGDYWWPDPENPDGPYIRKDGLSNPSNFLEHRIAMRNLNEWVSTLVAAFDLSGERKYADHALKHLHAFFIDENTLMNPSLLYAQAIQGRHTGRGIGIIDTIHLIEVAKSILRLHDLGHLSEEEIIPYRMWFDKYATWMNTHQYGIDEKFHGNNHSTWWAAQIAAFAELAERDDLRQVAADQFKNLMKSQMSDDGSFPEELSRTKPYNYSLFNLEGYAVLCHLASTPDDNLWQFEGPNGSIRSAFDFMLPYISDKDKWIKEADVEHFDELPIQSVGFYLAANAFSDEEMKEVWSSLSPNKNSEEIKRTFPLWYSINWQ